VMQFSVVFAKDCDVNQFAESCLKWTFEPGNFEQRLVCPYSLEKSSVLTIYCKMNF
jgi:hypothetical protein